MHRTESHDCTDQLRKLEYAGVETHGLEFGPFESYSEERWLCEVCGECYTAEEVQGLLEAENAAYPLRKEPGRETQVRKEKQA
jgi:hypothetical protein